MLSGFVLVAYMLFLLLKTKVYYYYFTKEYVTEHKNHHSHFGELPAFLHLLHISEYESHCNVTKKLFAIKIKAKELLKKRIQ